MHRGAWRATIPGISMSRTRPSDGHDQVTNVRARAHTHTPTHTHTHRVPDTSTIMFMLSN